MYVDNNMRHRVNAANILQTLPPRLRAMVQVGFNILQSPAARQLLSLPCEQALHCPLDWDVHVHHAACAAEQDDAAGGHAGLGETTSTKM